MTNAEKYLKENVNVDEFVSNFLHKCNCPREDLEMFLNDEVKPTLTEDEKVILRNINKFYTHIKRTNIGELRIASGTLGAEIYAQIDIFNKDLFQFIQPRRRI